MVSGCFHCGLSLVISDFKISSMLDVQRDCSIIHRSEDRSLALIVAGIHVRPERQQLLFYFREKRFVKRRISIFVARVHICASFNEQADALGQP